MTIREQDVFSERRQSQKKKERKTEQMNEWGF